MTRLELAAQSICKDCAHKGICCVPNVVTVPVKNCDDFLEPIKRGKWIHMVAPNWAKCSCCGMNNKVLKRWKYCPECGADLREENDE